MQICTITSILFQYQALQIYVNMVKEINQTEVRTDKTEYSTCILTVQPTQTYIMWNTSNMALIIENVWQ